MDQGNFLLSTQVVLISLLFYLGNIKGVFINPLLVIIFAAGIIVVIIGAFKLGIKSNSPHPAPSKTNKLITDGIYSYIRHPYYTGLAICGLALVFASQKIETFIVYAVFLVVQNWKADLEEELLSKKYKEYHSYAAKTKKFIPFVY